MDWIGLESGNGMIPVVGDEGIFLFWCNGGGACVAVKPVVRAMSRGLRRRFIL